MSKKRTEWDRLKQKGNPSYKAGKTEPIDLIKDNEMLHNFALGNIIKYAVRSSHSEVLEDLINNMNKIIHYAELLREAINEKKREKSTN